MKLISILLVIAGIICGVLCKRIDNAAKSNPVIKVILIIVMLILAVVAIFSIYIALK